MIAAPDAPRWLQGTGIRVLVPGVLYWALINRRSLPAPTRPSSPPPRPGSVSRSPVPPARPARAQRFRPTVDAAPLTRSDIAEIVRREIRETLRTELPRLARASIVDVVSTADAAALAGVTERTIRRWVADGRLSPLGGRPYRFRRVDVERARDRRPADGDVIDIEARADAIMRRGRR